MVINSTKENRNLSHIPAIVDYLKELNILSVIVRILLAIICGGVIGIERKMCIRDRVCAAPLRSWIQVYGIVS